MKVEAVLDLDGGSGRWIYCIDVLTFRAKHHTAQAPYLHVMRQAHISTIHTKAYICVHIRSKIMVTRITERATSSPVL